MEKIDFTTTEGQQWLKGLLHDENVQDLCITFTKQNGEERRLYCTLAEDRIPETKRPKDTNRVASQDAQPVYDVELGEWRSFRWDSVKAVEFNL